MPIGDLRTRYIRYISYVTKYEETLSMLRSSHLSESGFKKRCKELAAFQEMIYIIADISRNQCLLVEGLEGFDFSSSSFQGNFYSVICLVWTLRAAVSFTIRPRRSSRSCVVFRPRSANSPLRLFLMRESGAIFFKVIKPDLSTVHAPESVNDTSQESLWRTSQDLTLWLEHHRGEASIVLGVQTTGSAVSPE